MGAAEHATASRAAPPGLVLAAAAAAQASVSYVTYGLPAIGPQLRAHYHLSLAGLGAVLTANLFGSGLALVASGVVIERFGARLSMLAGTALGVLGLLAAAFSGSSAVLFAALLVSGIGTAVVPVAGAGALFRVYPPARRGWALGVRQMAVPLGGTIAAVTLPPLERAGGVQLPLLVGAGALAVFGCAFAPLAGDERAAHRFRLELRRILGAPGMLRLLGVAACYIVVLQAVLTYVVDSAHAAGLSSFAASATFFAVNVTAVVARLVWGKVADLGEGSRRARTLVDLGLVAAVGAVLFTFALHVGAALVVPAAVLFGFGAFGWNAIVYVSAGERTGPELAGRAVAVALTVVFVLSAVCTPPLGALADHAGWNAFWLTTGAIALVGARLASRLRTA
jgi:MFS family permease